MTQERIMRRLRAANPAPTSTRPSHADQLFTRLVAQPGDARLTQERGPEVARADQPEAGRARRLRPRVFAGGTLGLAGVGAAVLLAVSAAGTPPAFAITRNGDGSVTVQINEATALPQANAKLTAMGIHEQVTIDMATGPAAVSGPVNCTPAPGASLSGPPLKVLVGTDGTEVIGSGQSAGNTGAGTFHLTSCVATGDSGSGSSADSTGTAG